jgi:2'-5' RNA ligase
MKQRKIFLGIGIPREVAKRLMKRTEKWRELPLRLIKEGNLHITVLFLGHVLDESVARICRQTQDICRNIEAFDLSFDTITLVPQQGAEAKQLWFTGDASEELRQLLEAIEKEFAMWSAEKKAFYPHITLGRVRKQLWQACDPAPEIRETFSAALPVESVMVYESVFQKGKGLVHEVLTECPLRY